MRIGLVAYLLHGGHGYRAAGVSTYAQRLIEALSSAPQGHRFSVFHGRDAPDLHGVKSVLSPLPTQHPPARIAWEQIGLPVQAAIHRQDVIHGLVNVAPLASRTPTVVTIHDLAFVRYPERFHRAKVAYLRAAVRLSAHRARQVIAVSEHTRRDAIELLGVHPARISVVYPGVDSQFTSLPDETVRCFRNGVLGGRPYVLYVGTLEPRKNVDVLIRAFAAVRERRGLPHRLVLIGGKGWMYEGLFELVETMELYDVVRFQDFVDSSELPLWYNAADLFAYPSAYEGFGLPVLEAMACGVPTITTMSSSLAEVAGSACLTVEPGSQEALEAAMEGLLGSSELQKTLRTAGFVRAAQFTWARTADETIRVYEQVVGA